jgi:hypothetical protein
MAKGTFKVTLDGRGPIILRDSDYVATGGEGSIYRANDTIVKLYTDAAKMSRDGMDGKIRTLAKSLQHQSIIAPQGLVLDDHGSPAGFYMPFAAGEPMARAFVSDFRTRTGFSDTDAVNTVERMREVVEFAHSQKAVMVDANELNWLVDLTKTGPIPKVIDVDSWAIGRWPATVVMPSIRDWSAKTFDEKTDWFSWGIVSFQLFTGIHSYKGKLDGYKPGEMIRRMKENASVFSPHIKLPHSVRGFSCIPSRLLDWFQATFHNGLRTVPPSVFGAPVAAAAKVMHAATIPGGGAITFEKLIGYEHNAVLRVWPSGAARLASGDVINLYDKRIIGSLSSNSGEVIKTPHGWLFADWRNGSAHLSYYDGSTSVDVPVTTTIKRYFRSGNRLFSITGNEMGELYLSIFNKPIVTIGSRMTIRHNSTAWFDGVGVQDVFGNAFLILPTDTGLIQPRIKELDGANIISAKGVGRFATFTILDKSGDYRKVEITFDRSFNGYTAWTGNTDNPNLNIAILPSGVAATIVNDGELVLFVPANGNIDKISDRTIQTDMMLATWGDKLLYLRSGEVWRITKS